MSTVLFIAMLTGLNTRMSKAKQTVKMDMMQEFRGEEKNAVPTSIRNPRIFWSPTLHCGAASRVHCTLYLALSVRRRRWQRIIHSPQSQDLDSQTQTEHCRSSLAGGKCDIQKIATSSYRVSRFGIDGSRKGVDPGGSLRASWIGARLEMLMPHLKYIKAANFEGTL